MGDGWHQKFLYSVTAGIGDVGRGRDFCGVAILSEKLYSDTMLHSKIVATGRKELVGWECWGLGSFLDGEETVGGRERGGEKLIGGWETD